MKTLTTFSTSALLIAVAVGLAPAGSAVAAQDGTGAPGPTGPMMTAEGTEACRNDPHRRIQEQLWADGPSYECMALRGEGAGARGPAGPLMEESSSSTDDPFRAYDRAFPGD